MKFFAVVILAALAITAQALSDDEKAKIKEFSTGCLTSSEVQPELISKARAQEYSGRDPKLANYYACMLGKMGFQKAVGSFDVDRMVEKLPGNIDRDTATKAVKKCDTFDAALGKDENAMNFMYCFYKGVGKNFKLY